MLRRFSDLKTASITKEFPMLPEILAKAEMMERITTDSGDNSGLMLVSSVLVSFEGFGRYSVQFTSQDIMAGVKF